MLVDILAFTVAVWLIAVYLIIKHDERYPHPDYIKETKCHEEQSKRDREEKGIGF